MKSGTSSLNPFAASYVPLSRREVKNENRPVSYHGSPKNHIAKSPRGLSSQTQNAGADKHVLDERFEIDLEYLQMEFPGVSDQSLTDVYHVNKGDMEATIDMLNQLELFDEDCYETLPETLDIGDISESPKSATSTSKKPSGESSNSPSGESSNSPSPRIPAVSPK